MKFITRRNFKDSVFRAECRGASPLSTKRISTSSRRQNTDTTVSKINEPNGPLKGVKILDLSRVLAAPFCTQILADYGADVIKVEDVDRGDDTRHWKVTGEDSAWNADIGPMSNYFAAVNRNKRSLALNLKHEEGRNIFLQLVNTVDVVVDNFRPGALDRLGLGYEVLAKVNPKVIHASVSGYGASGPYGNRAGYDMIAGAEAGLLHLTGERGGPPVRPGLGLTDICTGLYTHGAIIAALYSRRLTGTGQKIDSSLFETQVALLTNVALSWLNLGQEAERWGTQHASIVPYDAFQTKDLYLVCGATNDKQFSRLCKELGLESLPGDERFRTNADRVRNRDDLYPLLNKTFRTRSTDEWIAKFEGSGMPYAPINNMERVFDHPQTHAREMVAEIEFPPAKSGSIKLLAPPVKFSKTKASIRTRPPLLGEHTEEILKEMHISDEKIKILKEKLVVHTPKFVN